ncbi:LIC_12613 family protein [Leptospira yasudae]|uniref:LIC_12613 family protein n=1 Tax=Leptospira yasudae TaxID=2202201 RepID=UPI00384BDADC
MITDNANQETAKTDKKITKNSSHDAENSVPSEPILETIDDDAKVAQIHFVDGRRYKLQHPGNRKALRWRQESISLTEGLNQDKLMDKFFKFCVKPVDHGFEPTLDVIEPNHVEVWLHVANRFLKWELE